MAVALPRTRGRRGQNRVGSNGAHHIRHGKLAAPDRGMRVLHRLLSQSEERLSELIVRVVLPDLGKCRHEQASTELGILAPQEHRGLPCE